MLCKVVSPSQRQVVLTCARRSSGVELPCTFRPYPFESGGTRGTCLGRVSRAQSVVPHSSTRENTQQPIGKLNQARSFPEQNLKSMYRRTTDELPLPRRPPDERNRTNGSLGHIKPRSRRQDARCPLPRRGTQRYRRVKGLSRRWRGPRRVPSRGGRVDFGVFDGKGKRDRVGARPRWHGPRSRGGLGRQRGKGAYKQRCERAGGVGVCVGAEHVVKQAGCILGLPCL